MFTWLGRYSVLCWCLRFVRCLAFERLKVDVRCYIVLHYYILYYIFYLLYIYYYYIILYSPPLLFFRSLLIFLPSSQYSFYTCRSLLTVIYIPDNSDPACFIGVDGYLCFSWCYYYYILYLILYSSLLPILLSLPFLCSNPPPSPLPIFHKNLTPHVLSEWMVEVCRFEYLGILFGVWR